jgi:hypothetical protein
VQLSFQLPKEITMRISKLLLIGMCCLVAAPAVWGQAATSQSHQGILGFLDPQTGAFRLIQPAAEDNAEPPALTTFTGTITVTITVTLKTAGLSSVVCSATTSVEDGITTGSPRSFFEQDTVAGTGSGGTRKCALSIPYSWGLATQSSDTMTTSYTVTGSGATATTPPIRSSSLSPLDSRKVPANGATTALTAGVTL